MHLRYIVFGRVQERILARDFLTLFVHEFFYSLGIILHGNFYIFHYLNDSFTPTVCHLLCEFLTYKVNVLNLDLYLDIKKISEGKLIGFINNLYNVLFLDISSANAHNYVEISFFTFIINLI